MTTEAPSGNHAPAKAPAAVVLVAATISAALLVRASITAETNPATFWFGLGAVSSASLALVVGWALVSVRQSSRPLPRAHRLAAWTAALGVVIAVGVVVVGQGADQWCTNEALRRSSQGAAQSLSLSGLPPGVRCTLTFDDSRVEVHWPFDR